MSAIGLSRPKAKLFISCHADYRREDFMFPRTQSNAMRNVPWEHTKPLQSWDRFIFPCVGLVMCLAAAVEFLR